MRDTCVSCQTTKLFYDTSVIKIEGTKDSVTIAIREDMAGIKDASLCLRCAVSTLEKAKGNNENETVVGTSHLCGYTSTDTAILNIRGKGSRDEILDRAIKELKSWPFKK